MSDLPIRFHEPVVLAGGGALDRETLALACRHGGPVIAADGAANRVAELGFPVTLAVGDMDSIDEAGRRAAERTVHLPEQDSTDFEKCLRVTEAPLYLAVGFTGKRVDHTLAVLSAMLKHRERRIVLIGEQDVGIAAPAGRSLKLQVGEGARVSIFPMRPVMGRSQGLVWPIDGLTMAPGAQVGTSNRAAEDEILIHFETEGAILLLECSALVPLIGTLRP